MLENTTCPLMNEDATNGDFEYAVWQLIADLVEGRRSNSEMLYRWDQARGSDWMTATKKRPAVLTTT